MYDSETAYLDWTNYTALAKSITFSDEITTLAPRALYMARGITSIKLPSKLSEIGEHVVSQCSRLQYNEYDNAYYLGSENNPYMLLFSVKDTSITNYTINDNVKFIYSNAFRDCSELTSITISNSVTSIGSDAFYGCSKLQGVYISDISAWCNIEFDDGNHYYNDVPYSNPLYSYSTNLYLNGEKPSGSIVISNGVKNIPCGTFRICENLTSITIPGSVTSIGVEAFYGCSGLDSITIPDSVTSIGSYAFYNCEGLTNITIGNSVTSIGERAFAWCSGLTSITIPDNVTSIGEDAFWNCSGLTSITIPDSVTSIGDDAFGGCYKLVEIINKSELNITKGSSSNGGVAYYALNVKTEGTSDIVKVNDYLFYTYNNVNYLVDYVGNDTELVLPDNYNGQNYVINQYAFYNCSKLTSITSPDSVTSIGGSAFEDCRGLTSITIPDSVTSIGDSAFSWCYTLTSATIGNNVTSIGNYAFQYCSGLTSITIPDSVTSIGGSAFEDCRGLTSITIGNSVTSIGGSAFEDCRGLTSITIGNSVTSICYEAFYNCSRLKGVYITDIAAWCNIEFAANYNNYRYYSNPLYYAHNLYLNNVLVTDLVIPNTVTVINDYVFYNAACLQSVTIPDGVTSIGYYAFYNCSNLKYNEYDNAYYLGNDNNPYIVLVKAKDTSITSCTINDKTKFIHSSAFQYCSGLTRIDFNGTKAQWKAISKGSDWKSFTGEFTVYCTDGNIAKENA